MNKVFRILGRIAVPAALSASIFFAPQVSFGQILSRSAASVNAGSDRLLRPNSITEIAASNLLQVDGTIRVAGKSKATLKLNSQSVVRGLGSMKVEPGSTLIIDSSQGQLGKIRVDNQGTIVLKGTLDCTLGLDFRTSGTLILDTASITPTSDVKSMQIRAQSLYPSDGAVFTVQSGGVLTGSGVLDGDLVVEPGGTIVLSADETGSTSAAAASALVVRDSSGQTTIRKPAMPSPSPDCIVINGDVTMSNSIMDVTIGATYYGQLSVTGSVTLGNGTLNCYLDGYTPAYADAFRIIKATSVGGQFSTFNTTCLNYDNRGIISITGGQAYRLSGY